MQSSQQFKHGFHEHSPSSRLSGLLYGCATLFLFFGISSLQFHTVLFESMGYEGTHFTLLLVVGNLSALFAPFIAGGLTKMLGNPRWPMFFLLSISGFILPFLPAISNYYLLLPLYFGYTFCIWGIFPLYMACGMEVYRQRGHHHFFKIRSVGTLGFAIGCLVSALFVDVINLSLLYPIFGCCFLLSVLFIHLTPAFKYPPKIPAISNSFPKSKREWKQILPFFQDKAIKKLLPSFMLLGCSNAMALAVQSNFILRQEGGTHQIVSISWFLCSAFEIPVMFSCYYIMKRFGLVSVLLMGFVVTVIRLVGVAYSPGLFWLLGFLSLHGFYYAGVITGLGLLIDKSEWPHRSAVQPMFALFYSGIPNIVGAFAAGSLWALFSLETIFFVSAALSLASLIILLPNLRAIKKRF